MPKELALLVRSEYRPRQTLLHHAAAVGNLALIDTLLAFDRSLALIEVQDSVDRYIHPLSNALMAAVAALQPAAVRALLPHSWPPALLRQRAAAQQGQQTGGSAGGSGQSSPTPSNYADPLMDLGGWQVDLLARLLHSIAAYDKWPALASTDGNRWWHHWPQPPQPRPDDLQQRAEATLLALLEGPQGGWMACAPAGLVARVVQPRALLACLPHCVETCLPTI
jgi:hypothetical protein